MTQTLRILLALAGLVIAAIATANITLGLHTTGLFFESFLPNPSGFNGLAGTDADSELRFYAVFFLAYGCAAIWLAWHFPRHHIAVPPMLALFFAGGLARGLSWLSLGAPHTLFQILLALELTLPPILWLLYRTTQNRLPK